MDFVVKRPIYNAKGEIELQVIPKEEIVVPTYSLMGIDGATGNSGIAIVRESDAALLYLIDATRDKSVESPVRYKIMLKKEITELLRRNHYIHEVYYEQPIVGNVTAIPNLFMLRVFIEEMIIENEPEFNYLGNFEVNNTHWKKLLIGEEAKLPQQSDAQKAIVREYITSRIPVLSQCTQDCIDAFGLASVAAKNKQHGLDGKDLTPKKATRPFKYNSIFAAADDDEAILTEFQDLYNGPEKLIQNGVSIVYINKREKFDKAVYEAMGDDDRILIVRFDSSSHGNLILEHNIGSLAAQYEYLYAIIWRANRK